MKMKITFLLLLGISSLSLFSFSPSEVEDLYFNFQGIWRSSQAYGRKAKEIRTDTLMTTWGTIKYSPDSDLLINILGNSPTFGFDKIRNISLENNDAVIEIDLGRLQQDNRFIYLRVIDDDHIRILKRELSYWGGNLDYYRISGPKRVDVSFNAKLEVKQKVYQLPFYESQQIGIAEELERVQVIQMTLYPSLVENYDHWVKIVTLDGIIGWVPRSEILPLS